MINSNEEITVAVGQLSEGIAPPGVEPTLVSRQIRHWTNNGLLKTAEEKFGGSGKHRRYDKRESLHASLLAELAQYSLTIGALKKAIDSLYSTYPAYLGIGFSSGWNDIFVFSVNPDSDDLNVSRPFLDAFNEEFEFVLDEGVFGKLKTGILVNMFDVSFRVEKLFNTSNYQFIKQQQLEESNK